MFIFLDEAYNVLNDIHMFVCMFECMYMFVRVCWLYYIGGDDPVPLFWRMSYYSFDTIDTTDTVTRSIISVISALMDQSNMF